MWRMNGALLVLCCAITPVAPGQASPPVRDTVPADLRPLLAPHRSEMRLVSLRYNADRNLLAANYAGGGRGPRGRSVPDTVNGPPIEVSPNRIARLKHFDTSWQAALD